VTESRADQLEAMWKQVYRPNIESTHSYVLSVRNKVEEAISHYKMSQETIEMQITTAQTGTEKAAIIPNPVLNSQMLDLREQRLEIVEEIQKLTLLLKRVENAEP
jgi:hypothetical protein